MQGTQRSKDSLLMSLPAAAAFTNADGGEREPGGLPQVLTLIT